MRFKNPTRVYDFLHLLHIYLLQKHKLNHRNYYEKKINMIYFIQAKGYDMNMHANIPCMNMHGFL